VATTTAGAPAPPTVAHPWAAALVLGGAIFMVLFDSLAVATALPTIGTGLDLNRADLQWVVNLNSLSIGGLLLLGGRASDLWGRRRVLVASLALLTLGTVVAGAAPALPVLLAGRVLQGAAAAFALPASLAMTGTLFRDEPWHSRAFAVVSVSGCTAGLAGAICGGLLTDAFGWRWVFLATVPLSLVALGAALRFLPADPAGPAAVSGVSGPGRRLDMTGAVLATAGLTALILGIARVAESGPLAADVAGPVGAGLALLAAFVAVERRVPHPLLRPRLLRSRRLAGGCLGIAAHSASYSAVIVVGSLHLQDTYALSAGAAGLALAPVLLVSGAGGFGAGALLRRFGARRVAGAAIALGGAALVMLAVDADRTGYLTAVLPWFLLWSLGGGAVYIALTRECIGGAAEEDRGTTSGVFEATTHIGGAIAVATYVTLIGTGSGYRGAYLAGAVFALAGSVAVLLLLRPAGGGRPGGE
jgi:MFS family permease